MNRVNETLTQFMITLKIQMGNMTKCAENDFKNARYGPLGLEHQSGLIFFPLVWPLTSAFSKWSFTDLQPSDFLS